MAARASAAHLPRWTKRVVTEVGGRDPLGLSRVAHVLTEHLMRGIITTTNRARFYSLYCWMLDHIPREESPTNDEDYVAAFQRREAAIAFATLLSTEDVAPLGVRAVRPPLEQAKEGGTASVNFRVLPSSRLGGYSQNYAGCLYELGLTHNPDGTSDRLVTGFAESLAEAVDDVLEPAPYLKQRLFEQDSVPLVQLDRSAHRLSRLLKLLKLPAKGRYDNARIFAGVARQLGISLHELGGTLHRRNGGPHQYWRIGTTEGKRSEWPRMRDGGFMAIGWPDLGDLSSIAYSQGDKDRVRELMAGHYPGTAQVVSRKANQVFHFVTRPKERDLVLAMDGTTVRGIGRVTGDYFFAEDDGSFVHRRPVDRFVRQLEHDLFSPARM